MQNPDEGSVTSENSGATEKSCDATVSGRSEHTIDADTGHDDNMLLDLLVKSHLSDEEIQAMIRSNATFSRKREFLKDINGKAFPTSVFTKKQINGEEVEREWLIWNSRANGLQCIPCRLFSKLPGSSKSRLSKPDGITRWTKVHEKVGAHENSNDHKSCYIIWKKRQSDIKRHWYFNRGCFC